MASENTLALRSEPQEPNFVWTNSMGVYRNIDREYDGRNLSRREKRVLKRDKQRDKLNKHQ